MIVLWLIVFEFVVVSVLACASSFFTPAPFPLVCVVSSIPMCHHPHPMCCGVCVLCEACHIHCVVVGTLQHTALLCTILSALLFLSLSLPPPSPEKKHTGGVEKREGERSGWERERKRKKRGVMQKRVEKKGQKEKKRLRHLVFPGCLQP